MQRRSFLTALGTAPVMTGLQRPSSSSRPPRKVIAGTVMQPYWEQHPGLKNRLTQLTGNVDRMQEESQHRFGRGLDLAILPEVAVTGETGRDVAATAVPLEGEVREAFAAVARKHHCYLVAPTFLKESAPEKGYSNAAIFSVGVVRSLALTARCTWSFPKTVAVSREAARPGTTCLCSTATSASLEFRSVTTWSSITVGMNLQ